VAPTGIPPTTTPEATVTPPPTATTAATATPPLTATATVTPTPSATATRTPSPTPKPAALPVAAVKSSANADSHLSGPNLLDGNLATRWETTFTTPDEAWFVLDLGQRRRVERARWYVADARFAPSFRLEISDDGQRWTRIATLSAGADSFVWQERAVNREGRYLRWFFTNPTRAGKLGSFGEAQAIGS
jgi:hypothetical protein